MKKLKCNKSGFCSWIYECGPVPFSLNFGHQSELRTKENVTPPRTQGKFRKVEFTRPVSNWKDKNTVYELNKKVYAIKPY